MSCGSGCIPKNKAPPLRSLTYFIGYFLLQDTLRQSIIAALIFPVGIYLEEKKLDSLYGSLIGNIKKVPPFFPDLKQKFMNCGLKKLGMKDMRIQTFGESEHNWTLT